MLIRSLLFTLALLALGLPVQAQTLTRTLAWTHQGDVVATVNTYTFTVKIDTAAPMPVTPTCQTSPTVAANVDCVTPITLTSGAHVIILTASKGNDSASAALAYNPPSTPTNLKIIIQITVP